MADVIPIREIPENEQLITELALSFPTLTNADGITPWDPEKLDAWACGGASHGGRLAVQFILAVWHGQMGRLSDKPRKTPEKHNWHGTHRWNLDTHWRVGPFDAVRAMGTWDERHRSAYISWLINPWWP